MPGDAWAWNWRAVTWTHLNTEARAEKVLYFCGPIGREMGESRRARKLARLIRKYHGWRIVLVGHSNGGDVILNALKILHHPPIAEIHFISAACAADFRVNGMNHMLAMGTRIMVYIGAKDLPLRAANIFWPDCRRFGTLGLHGPRNVSEHAGDRVRVILRNWGHSGWWTRREFAGTMRAITRGQCDSLSPGMVRPETGDAP